jgi:drug/metabolite transporter (DMT)-like permease
MPSKRQCLLSTHLAVFMFGFAGLFGKFVNLPAPVLVSARCGVAAVLLAAFIVFRGKSLRLSLNREYWLLALTGLVLAVHWSTFFQSIQVSTVTIGLLGFSVFPFFVAILEPIILKAKFKYQNILTSIIILFGVFLIAPELRLSCSVMRGILWGVLSGFLFALLTVLNKRHMTQSDNSSLLIVCYQCAFASIFTLPLVFTLQLDYQANDLVKLLILGSVFTAVSHVLFISGMSRISAQLSAIIASLEPIYGIILAIFFLGEIPTTRTILGGIVILLATFWASNNFRYPRLQRLNLRLARQRY